jgi:hypothetical protein
LDHSQPDPIGPRGLLCWSVSSALPGLVRRVRPERLQCRDVHGSAAIRQC